MDKERTDRVLYRMQALCSRREYCRADMMKKIVSALDGDKAEAERIVDILVKDKYIDDLRYASAFARDKSALTGWGQAKIKYALSMKGVPEDLISRALDEIDGGKAQIRLEKLLENKIRSLKDDPQWKMKLIRFALGRGYNYEEIYGELQKIDRRGN